MGKLRLSHGSLRVDLEDGTEELVRRALEDVAPGVLAEIEGTLERVKDEAHARWPVKTGESRDGLRVEVAVSGDGSTIRGSIVNVVPYAVYIRAKNLSGKSAVVELLRKPIALEAVPLSIRLSERLAAILGSGR